MIQQYSNEHHKRLIKYSLGLSQDQKWSRKPLVCVVILTVLYGIVGILGEVMLVSHDVQAAEAPPKGPKLDPTALKNQGLLYFRKKMYIPAREQFDLAYSTPEGSKDFIVVYYRAKLAYMQLKLEVAFEMAELAVTLAEPGTSDVSEAKKLLDELNGQFSYVEINKAQEERNKRGRIYLEVKRRILNKTKREQFESIRTRFRSTDVELPTKIYLPYGDYTANNVPFQIKRGTQKAPSVTVFLAILRDDESGTGTILLYTGLGVVATAAIGIGTYFILSAETTFKEKRQISFSPRYNDNPMQEAK